MPNIPLDAFRACIFTASVTAEWAYRSQVVFAGIYCPLSCRSSEPSYVYRPYCHRLHCHLRAEIQGQPRPVAHDPADANDPPRQCPLFPHHGGLPHRDGILHFLRQGNTLFPPPEKYTLTIYHPSLLFRVSHRLQLLRTYLHFDQARQLILHPFQFNTGDDFTFGDVPPKGRRHFARPGLEWGSLYRCKK